MLELLPAQYALNLSFSPFLNFYMLEFKNSFAGAIYCFSPFLNFYMLE